MKESSDWNVWLTGASSGIGEALARELGGRGAKLALFARREERLKALRDDLVARGSEVLVQPGDVRDRSRIREAVREAEDRFGAIDVAILNAGIGDSMFVDDFDAELVTRIMDVNFCGAVYGVEAVLPGMIQRGRGTIVGMSSIAGVRGLPSAAPYCASKAALSTFLESLRLDLKPHNVTVITVSPGFIATPMTNRNRFPMPFLQPADRAARRIVVGIGKGKRHIHFPLRLTVPTLMLRLLPVPIYDFLMGSAIRRHARGKNPETEELESP